MTMSIHNNLNISLSMFICIYILNFILSDISIICKYENTFNCFAVMCELLCLACRVLIWSRRAKNGEVCSIDITSLSSTIPASHLYRFQMNLFLKSMQFIKNINIDLIIIFRYLRWSFSITSYFSCFFSSYLSFFSFE